jgi:hypothetical protein
VGVGSIWLLGIHLRHETNTRSRGESIGRCAKLAATLRPYHLSYSCFPVPYDRRSQRTASTHSFTIFHHPTHAHVYLLRIEVLLFPSPGWHLHQAAKSVDSTDYGRTSACFCQPPGIQSVSDKSCSKKCRTELRFLTVVSLSSLLGLWEACVAPD